MPNDEKTQLIHHAIETSVIYLSPTALSRSRPETRGRFRSHAEVLEELFRQLQQLPTELLRLMATQGEKHLFIKHEGAYYNGSTAVVSVDYIYLDEGVAIEEVMHLLDDLLGDGSGRRDQRFSDGYTRFEKLHGSSTELVKLFERPQRFLPSGEDNPHEYFAQGVRVFLYQPEQLQREDPELFLVVRDKILNENFWKEVFNS